MIYEMEEHDEMGLAECLYDKIFDMVRNGETVRLRPIAVHCDVTIADLQDRTGQIALIELHVRRELGVPDED